MDGCEHAWFEDRGPACTLLGYVDDATGRPRSSGATMTPGAIIENKRLGHALSKIQVLQA